jgi:hypothetical protein
METIKSRTEMTTMNVVNAIAGAFLFVSPWLFRYTGTQTAEWSAWIGGLVIAVLAIAAVVALQQWEEWVNLVVGALVVAAPWFFGFAGITAAMWSHVAVGLVVAVLAAVELWMIQQSPHVPA